MEAHHSQLECSVPPQLAFAYSAHLVTRWAHSRRWLQGCQTQGSNRRLAHSEHCSLCRHLDQVTDWSLAHPRLVQEQEN